MKVPVVRVLGSLLVAAVACGCVADAAGHAEVVDGPRRGAEPPIVEPPVAGERAAPRKAPLVFTSHGVYLPARIGAVDVYLTLDTASWFTRVPRSIAATIGVSTSGHFTAPIVLGGGARTIDLGARGIEILDGGSDFTEYPDLPKGAVVAGTAGNDLFADGMMGIDYANGELWFEGQAAEPAHPGGTRDPIVVPAERPRARSGKDEGGIVLVPCAFAEGVTARRCMLDTGSPPDLALGAAWNASPHAHPKRIPAFATDFEGALLAGYYQRADVFTLGGEARRERAPILVFDRFPVLEAEARHFGVELAGLVGNASLSGYFTVIDYPGARVVLFPYVKPPVSVDPQFHGHGFVLGAAKGDGVELTVIEGSLAAQEGVRSGDVLVGIEGDYEISQVSALVLDAPGDKRTFQLVTDGVTRLLRTTAEELLP